jgi:hypothetical protein
MPYEALFKKLFDLKHQNHALWNGKEGGVMIRIFNDKPEQVISFSRSMKDDQVISIINYSAASAVVKLDSKYQKGKFKELFTGKEMELKGDDTFTLEPWKYLVLVK